MCKLFVLGNGFDLDHGLPTKYCDFKDWLKTEYNYDEEMDHENYSFPKYATNYRHTEEIDYDGFARLYINLIDNVAGEEIDTWKDYEKYLGLINWDLVFEDGPLTTFGEDWEDDDWDPFEDAQRQEDYYSSIGNGLLESSHVLNRFFYWWIYDVENNYIQKRKCIINDKIAELLKKDKFEIFSEVESNKFLSFNYTSTLETIYNIDNVCHIHGYIYNYDELIVGHGLYINNKYSPDDDFSFKDDAYMSFREIFNTFKKDTENCFKKNINFFKSLKDCKEIYIFGLSLSDVDMYYLDIISKVVTKDVKIFINVHNKEEEKEYKDKLLKIFKNVELWK